MSRLCRSFKRRFRRYLVSFHNIATTRSTSARAASAWRASQYPHATATRSAARVSFALPAAVNSRALRLPGSE